MSTYDWPRSKGPAEKDDPAGRAAFLAPRRTDVDRAAALAQGRNVGPPRAAPADAGILAAPIGQDELWIPLGPSNVVGGQATGAPRITGRARALAVHPTGNRLYAATANGGVWYSPDAGASWRSLGGLGATTRDDIVRPAHRHACGAILVRFGPGGPDDVAHDEVFVGTGEGTPPSDASAGSNLGGVGVLVATNPVGGNAFDPWDVEAPNLTGHGVYRLAMQPGGSTVVVATSIGLFQRPAGATMGTPWTRVDAAPFRGLEAVCTDVLWTPAVAGGAPGRLWAWISTGDHAGLWVRDDGAADFRNVATAGTYASRSVLAAATPPTKVYVFNDRYSRQAALSLAPALFRVTSGAGEPTAAAVAGVPATMLGHAGFYDMAITVHPSDPDRVVLGGKGFQGKSTAGKQLVNNDGAIFTGAVGMKSGVLTYGTVAGPLRFIGLGCHADVHDLQFADGGNELWTGCDGGVFRSRHPTKLAGFVARNDGLAVIEANYVASHPLCEGRVVLGLQDNGIVERGSSTLWHHTGDGDGGGVAFDPVTPNRYLRQTTRADWVASSGASFTNLLRRGASPLPGAVTENDEASFYSTPAVIRHTRGTTVQTQVVVGTHRAWYSQDWGATWVTLPTGTDPITTTTHNATQDGFGQPIRVCKWATSDIVWLLGDGRVERLVRQPGSDTATSPGTWTREVILQKNKKNKKDETSAEGPIRKAVVWTDLAVNPDAGGAQHGPKGAVYLGAVGKVGDRDVDTLWWFDGTKTWHPTGLRTHAQGVEAPVTAVLCDPANPDDVYVGTTVGVWYGERTLGSPPTWDWRPLVNGLPEAVVEDLSLYDSGGLRLLRAAIAARGVWEMRLDTPNSDLTYLRAHDDDLRYRDRAITTSRDGEPGRSWHGSPDVRPRPAPEALPPPPDLPWTKVRYLFPRDEALRRFQAALRSQRNDDRVRATGEWDDYFEEVLRDLGAPLDGTEATITDALWNSVMVAPHATAEPWGAGQPSEVDLHDLTLAFPEGVVRSTSCTLPAGPLKVDVVVHHRGMAARAGGDVRITLLRWIDPKTRHAATPEDVTTWFSGDVPWTAAVNEVLNSGPGTTSSALGPGWAFAIPSGRRHLTLGTQRLESDRSGVATFDLDLTGRKPKTVVLLVAVIRAGADVALTPKPLDALALEHPGVAVRSLSLT